jgi:hypothetical protein
MDRPCIQLLIRENSIDSRDSIVPEYIGNGKLSPGICLTSKPNSERVKRSGGAGGSMTSAVSSSAAVTCDLSGPQNGR